MFLLSTCGLDSCCSWWSPRTWQLIWRLSLAVAQALASSPGVSAGASPRAMSRELQAIQYISESYLADLATEVLSQVNEVVTMEIRAVSHFFSNSKARFAVGTCLNLWNLSDSVGAIASYAKVWVAHLFKLMDLDSLPEHCAGDALLGSVRNVSFLSPVGWTWCCAFLFIILQKHMSCTYHTCSFNTTFWNLHAEICALPNPQDTKTRRVLQQNWAWIGETKHEDTTLKFFKFLEQMKPWKTNQGDIHALSSRNTAMQSWKRLWRAQRKPREMVQKVSKALPASTVGVGSALFFCLNPVQGVLSQTWVWFLF